MEYKGINIEWLGHAGFKVKNNIIIYIDPFRINTEEKADLILITHSHYDHCSLEDIKKILKPDTIIIGPPDVQSKIAKISYDIQFQIIQPFQKISVKDVIIETLPAYNINKQFHPKTNNWVGYLIEINGVRIYHAGDSDVTPELRQLKNIDVLMLPVGGTYTMNAREAAELANAIKPKIAVPMHYGSIVGTEKDAEVFRELCQCRVEIPNFYNST